MQEKEQMIGEVMRHMLFKQKQKPDQPVRRDELAKLFQVGCAPALPGPQLYDLWALQPFQHSSKALCASSMRRAVNPFLHLRQIVAHSYQ